MELPGYQILEKIGEGGMATVWTARQLSLDRIVAVKILALQQARDEEAVARFRQEAQAAARLKHPGIIQVYDAGEHNHLLYYVMEFVAGCTVAELLAQKGKLTEKNALLVAEGIALALGYAWDEARLIHCDVKPDNVMIDQDGTVKLADLGLARVLGARSRASADMIEGTPFYTAPEQARGDQDLDTRADIYSLGAMLYHMTTGKMPFGEMSGLAAMESQVSGYIRDPQEISPGLSNGFCWLVEKMMVKDRTLRYQSWAEIHVDLQEVKGGGLPLGKLPSAGQSTVLRSEARSSAAARRKEELKAKGTAGGKGSKVKVPAAGKQKIVVPKELRERKSAEAEAPTVDLARAVFSLILMMIVVALAYGGVFYFHGVRTHVEKVDQDYWNRLAPPRSQVKLSSGQQILPLNTLSPVTSPEPTATAPVSGETQKVDWRNPTFVKGADLFNDALAKYKKYQVDRQDPSVLEVVEQESRDAIHCFESVRSSAPDGVDIAKLVTQCYGLISDCRQSTLALAGETQPKVQGPISAVVSAAPANSAAPAVKDTNDLVLAMSWNGPEASGEKILRDLSELLNGQGKPDVDLKADPSLVIFGQIYYLMPVRDAAKIVGQPLAPKKNMACPGFPKSSLFYYVLEGNFSEGFHKMLLVADSSDRIVAVELVNEHPDTSLWLEPQLFAEKWHIYNLIQGRTKGSVKWRIGYRVQQMGRVVRLDSELVSNDEYGYFGLGDSKERVQLYLPQQIVNLILFRVRHLKGASGA